MLSKQLLNEAAVITADALMYRRNCNLKLLCLLLPQFIVEIGEWRVLTILFLAKTSCLLRYEGSRE